ncbi:hypothetical protein [Lacticaseibacillus paracasei]|uniref:hypothetical protein n=1 Tax=Lacticaseibacillus paracasei TaxID=1597 RepID=UPI0021C28F35|nr:hypothetical protein [Lacticaseibacillus paracasei]MCP9306247.1 hypothetical protein [Lacticaseibacillus paracasei]
MKRALQNTLNGTTDDGSAFYSGKGVVGYSVTNPGQMADDDQTINLSMVSEANGYAWAYKVLVPLIKMASDNALKDAENGNANCNSKLASADKAHRRKGSWEFQVDQD